MSTADHPLRPLLKLKNLQEVALAVLILVFTGQTLKAQTESDSTKKVQIEYTNKGFQFSTQDKKFLLHIESRLQFRFATPSDEDPVTFDQFETDKEAIFKINRARLKVGGNAFQPWLKYYWEYELSQSNLLDFRIMVEKWSFLKLKIGQWKVDYNRERSISSGKQQLVDRSIINRFFTLDRQQGIALFGRVNEGRTGDISYWASVLTGTGRGNRTNDDNNFMYVGRVQWNFLGRDLGYNNSDLTRHTETVAYLALAATTNQSPYTRFSQSGGGQLERWEDQEDGQFRVNQWMFETALMRKGFSWAQEFHRKEINDLINDNSATLGGLYLQAGYFFHEILPWVPEKLEMALRFAHLDPDIDMEGVSEQEYTIAFNYFFNGHRNKLTMEFTHFESGDEAFRELEKNRFRFQWDISL